MSFLQSMVIYNAATRELTAKIVYYGPGLGGKTTNLHVLHDRLEPSTVGKLLNLSTQTDRTIYFDLLPVELGDIKGYKIRFQLATVPGQTAFNETRRVVLKGTDGIVFVADSQWTMLPKNLESWQNLKENLKANGVSFEGIPVVVQYNKRDLTDTLSVDAMQEALGLSSYPFVEAVASAGRGVTETFKLISKLTFVDLLRRLQGRRPEDAVPPTRKEKDELLSWKDSLLNRSSPSSGRPPLSVVPSLPDESPFETDEPAPGESARAELGEGPFSGLPAEAPSPPDPSEIARVRGERVEDEPASDSEPPELLSEIEPAESLEDALIEAETREEPMGGRLELEERFPPSAAVESLEARVSEAERLASAAAESAASSEESRRDMLSRIAALEERASARENASEATAGKIRALEELLDALRPRLDDQEAAARELTRGAATRDERMDGVERNLRSATERVEAHDQQLTGHEQRLDATDRRLETTERHQRASEDDIALALQSSSERSEKLRQQIEDVAAQLEALAAAMDEKTARSQREAEDIRTQMAPLLEAHGQRHLEEERLVGEFDRLRESLADSLAELAERVRRAVRGL